MKATGRQSANVVNAPGQAQQIADALAHQLAYIGSNYRPPVHPLANSVAGAEQVLNQDWASGMTGMDAVKAARQKVLDDNAAAYVGEDRTRPWAMMPTNLVRPNASVEYKPQSSGPFASILAGLGLQ